MKIIIKRTDVYSKQYLVQGPRGLRWILLIVSPQYPLLSLVSMAANDVAKFARHDSLFIMPNN